MESLKLIKRCQEKMFPPYTKTFGGKIWKTLQSVPPDNFLGKKFKMDSFIISRQNSFKHHLVQKSWD